MSDMQAGVESAVTRRGRNEGGDGGDARGGRRSWVGEAPAVTLSSRARRRWRMGGDFRSSLGLDGLELGLG